MTTTMQPTQQQGRAPDWDNDCVPQTDAQFLEYLYTDPYENCKEDLPPRSEIAGVVEWGYQCVYPGRQERFVAMLLQTDGKFAAITGSCDYTGWD